ncbi:MAG: S9 family peptidase [Chitinophagaceae bacterium]|nr:S9 family peptidase [Chitinophagaceae bacterium]
MNMKLVVLLAGFGLFTVIKGYAQQKELDTLQMLKGKPADITQPLPVMKGWLDDAHFLLSKRQQPDSPFVTVKVDCKTGKETVVPDENHAAAGNTRAVYMKSGAIYLAEPDGSEKKIISDNGKKSNPVLSPDNKYIAFTRDNDLYTYDIENSKETRLTNDGSEVILNGYASWVYMEEILGRASRYRAFWWSPDSKRIAFFRTDDSDVPVFNIVGEEGAHGSLIRERYPKAGDPNPKVKVGIIKPEGGNVVWSDFNQDTDQYFGLPYWRPDGAALWIQWMNRGQDTLVVFETDITTGAKKELYAETQKTWVELDDMGKRITFLKDGKQFILQSDKTGWNMLYLYDINGKLLNPVTNGQYTVTAINHIDEKNQLIYFTCRKDNSARYDFYKVKFNGTDLKRLSFGEYTHQADVSPGGSYFITTYSNVNEPPQMALADTKGNIKKNLGSAKGSSFYEYTLAKTELVRVKSEDGKYDLPMKITWPLNYDPSQKYPVLISIYGGPDAGTVYDGYSFNGQQQWWAKEGLIQVAMDHRASGHFGKEGVNYMHRNLGYWEMKDWIQCVKWLIDRGADKDRIAISGFSYGGYITCYALTYGADYFKYGLAGGSVTDWSLYDTHYTERFMDTPRENPEGYKSSSVFTHVDKYKGLLRIYHGSLDDNVHLQNSLQLVKRLQEAKKHFEFMVYPGGLHGWGGNQALHSQNENNSFIYRNLLRKEMPGIMLR